MLFQQILRAEYSFQGSQWNIVSEEAKSFIHELLVLNPDHRLTASQALKHKWITDRNSNLSSSNNLKSGNRDRRKSVGVESKSKIELDMSLIYSKDASKVFSIDTGSTEAKKKTSMDTYQTSSTVSSHDIGDFKDRSGSLMQQLKLGALDIDDFKKCAIERSSSNDSINTRSTEPSDPQDLEIHHEDIEENTLNAKTFISPVNNNSTVIEGGNIRRPYRTRSSTKNGLVAQLGSEEKVTKIPWPITNGKHGEGTGVNKESGVTPNSRKRRQSVAMSTAAKKRRSSSTGRKSKTNPQKQGQIDIFFGKG